MNNHRIKKEIKKEINLEINENENRAYKNSWGIAKAVLKGIFIPINIYI